MYIGLSSACRQYIGIKGGSHCQMAGTSATCSFGEGTCTPAPTISRATQHAIIDTFMVPWLRYTLMGSCPDGAAFDARMMTDTSVATQSNCTLCSSAGTPVQTTLAAFAVHPNPAHQWLQITCTDSRYTQVELYSVDGRLLVSESWIPGKRIATVHLPAGIVVYRLSGPSVPSVSGRVLVQH